MSGTQKMVIGIVVLVCLVSAAVAGWALIALRSASAAATAQASLGPGRYGQEGLRVSGTAVVRAAPDLATVRLGYESRARRAREAKLANDRVMKKVLAAMEKQGVGRRDIQTADYRLFPVWEDWPTPTTRTLFWHVLHMVEVRVRKPDTVADVIDAASAAGADKVEGVEFAVDSLHKLRTQAREMAARVAREKAKQLAGLMGARLGKMVAVSDAGPSSSYGYYGYYGYSRRGLANVAQQAADVPSAAGPDTVVRGGQIVVEAREEVVFALE
jgi:hypothetical protein